MSFLKLKYLLTVLLTFSFINCLLMVPFVAGGAVRKDVASHPNWRLLDRGDDCGLSSSDRIIGGKKASIGQYPWIARLGFGAVNRNYTQSDMYFSCGGAIISDRYVLTAAHCSPIHNFPPWLKIEMVLVRLGEHDSSSDPDCQDGVCAPSVQDIAIEEYSCHPGYEKTNQFDDVCVVRLATPIKFNRYIRPICLPVNEWFLNKRFEDKMMEVAGWGVTDVENQTTSDVLLTLAVPVVSHSQCQKEFQGHSVITDKQICAGGVVGQDSCTGDSGGPLMASLSVDAPPRYFLMGIVSYGDHQCGSSQTPGVYTKVTEYLIWILDHIRE